MKRLSSAELLTRLFLFPRLHAISDRALITSPIGLEFAANEEQIRECSNDLVQRTSENVSSGKVILSSRHFAVLIDALEYMHLELKLVHRDIKLSNMLIANVNDPVRISACPYVPRYPR